MENFSLGLVLGVVVAITLMMAITEPEYVPTARAIESEFAHYDARTGDVVWDDLRVKYVATGVREEGGEK